MSDAPTPARAEPAATGEGSPSRKPIGRGRIWLARGIALAADAVQIGLLPFVLGGAVSPVDDVIDVVTAILMVALLGWHWAFLPTFLAEIVPFVDLWPSWTLAVMLVTRRKRS